MKSLFIATIALIGTSLSAYAEVRCEKVSNPQRAEMKDGYTLLEVRRPAMKGLEGQDGWVMIEIFGLDAAQARDTQDGNIKFIEACDVHSRFTTLRFKIRAYWGGNPDQGQSPLHVADVPVPTDLQNATIRWCSKVEQRCLESKFSAKNSPIYLESVGGGKSQRSKLQ